MLIPRWFGPRLVILPLVCALLGLNINSDATSPSPSDVLFERSLEVLESNYFGYASLDVDRLRSEYQPKLEQACKAFERCPYEVGGNIVSEMISSLQDPHTYRLGVDQTTAVNADFSGGHSINTQLGMTVASIPDAAGLVVKRLLETGPAALAGLQRGDLILGINAVPLEHFDSSDAVINQLASLERAGNPIGLDVLRDKQRQRVILKPEVLEPWLPQLELRTDGVGIITFFQFKTARKVANRVHELVRQAKQANVQALILDVRDSAGGLVSECLASVGAFLEPVSQTNEFRFGKLRFQYANAPGAGQFWQVNPDGSRTGAETIVNAPQRWEGPLVVLTNAKAKSAPEYLAHLLQRAKRATVIGLPTLGALNTSNGFFSLPDKSSMAVSMGRSLEPDGTPFPAKVIPDQMVPDDLAALSIGHDWPLEAALKQLGL